MSRGKHRLGVRALASAAAVFGVTALSVGGAQASQLPGLSTLGTYLVNLGSPLLTLVNLKQVGVTTLSIPGRLIEFKCQTSSILEGKISTSSDAQIQIEYSECLSTFSGIAHACDLKNKSFVLRALVLPILHSGEVFLLFQGLGGVPIVLPWEPKLGCPPESHAITGSITASVGALDAVKQLIVLKEEIQLLTGDLLKYGAFSVYMKSHAELELSGEHVGQKLGIH